MQLPPGTVARQAEWRQLTDFVSNESPHATLGIVWGRRRVGKSYLLSSLCEEAGGFYYEAMRGSRTEALADLGVQLGAHLGAPAPLSLPDWPTAVEALMQLAAERPVPVVLDEYPYLREHSSELDTVLQRAFAPRGRLRESTRCRLLVCGSAVSVMRGLLSGTAPLHGRAGLDLRLAPFDFRGAADLHGVRDPHLAIRTYAVIGGVAAYARDMVDDDLPDGPDDFDRWVTRRVLTPAAPLFREAELLLSEDPTISTTRKPNIYHSTLAAVAAGNHAFSKLTHHVGIKGSSLAPMLHGLVDADFVTRQDDPIRENRPQYVPADPLLRLHYAIIRPHQSRLSHAGADGAAIWQSLGSQFSRQIVGPVFEEMARAWARHYADPETLGGHPVHVGGSTLDAGGGWTQLDLVVAADDGETPGERSVTAIGEAKAGEMITDRHLRRLEQCRTGLGARGEEAKLLLVGAQFSADLVGEATTRSDVELVDLDRLYTGS